jgi:hypothetical protein
VSDDDMRTVACVAIMVLVADVPVVVMLPLCDPGVTVSIRVCDAVPWAPLPVGDNVARVALSIFDHVRSTVMDGETDVDVDSDTLIVSAMELESVAEVAFMVSDTRSVCVCILHECVWDH